jgi:hypothetical protein
VVQPSGARVRVGVGATGDTQREPPPPPPQVQPWLQQPPPREAGHWNCVLAHTRPQQAGMREMEVVVVPAVVVVRVVVLLHW